MTFVKDRSLPKPEIDYMLKAADVAKMLSVSRPIINAWRKEGKFPSPIMLTPSTPRWRLSTINDWVDSKSSKQDA